MTTGWYCVSFVVPFYYYYITMANRKIELTYKYRTASQVRERLGLSRFQFDIRLERGIFPSPTFTDVTGVRYFDENWVRIARSIMEASGQHK